MENFHELTTGEKIELQDNIRSIKDSFQHVIKAALHLCTASNVQNPNWLASLSDKDLDLLIYLLQVDGDSVFKMPHLRGEKTRRNKERGISDHTIRLG